MRKCEIRFGGRASTRLICVTGGTIVGDGEIGVQLVIFVW